jgi:hydrophobic/amphiphilic exporter-1 (mainly G- bacteria), HAE1 family
MRSLVSLAMRFPVSIYMLFLGILLLGMISLKGLPTNLFPDIAFPRITVVVETDGLSPEEVERRVSRPLERSIATLRNVREVKSISRADQSVVMVDFQWDTNLDFAFLDVKKTVGDLREDTASQSIFRFDPNALPVLTLALIEKEQKGQEDKDKLPVEMRLVELRRLAEKTLKPQLERIDGAAQAEISGGMDSEVLIQVDPNLLTSYNINYKSLSASIANANVNASGGWIEDRNQRYVIRALGQYASLEDIRGTVVGYVGNMPVTLADVSTSISRIARERDSLVRYNGVDAVGMAIYKEPDSNTIQTVHRIRKELKNIEEESAGRYAIKIAYDQSLFINAAINEVQQSALYGVLWAVLVLFLFLRRIRPTLIIAVAIPLSIVATFNLMYFAGLSLNIMTLGGLALGAGMLVDNAIVVLENIFRRQQLGDDAKTAAQHGTTEIGGAIISSTLTTVVVFFPIVYVHGFTGLLFKEQALTVCFSLMASLLAAILLIPVLSAKGLKMGRRKPVKSKTLYTRFLAAILHPVGQIMVIAMVGCAVYWSVTILPTIPRELVPRADQGQFVARLTMPLGSSLSVTDQAMARLEGRLAEFGDQISIYYTNIGESEESVRQAQEIMTGPHRAEISVTLASREIRTVTTQQVVDRLEEERKRIYGAKIEFIMQQNSIEEFIRSGDAPITVEVKGESLESLNKEAAMVISRLEQEGAFTNIRSNLSEGFPVADIQLDKTLLANLGMDTEKVAEAVRNQVAGVKTSVFQDEEAEIDIVLEMSRDTVDVLSTLRAMRITGREGRTVRLDEIAKVSLNPGPREILRRGGERYISINADLREVKLSEGVERARAALDDMPFYATITGEEERRKESFQSLRFALILALILVYMVMASLFESLIHPLTVMFTAPLALVGVIAAFILTGGTLNMMALIGMVMLAGIVVNNAIVLVDAINRILEQSGDLKSAIIQASQRRLRPILMTSLTTMMALMPMALGVGEGAELRAPMAIAVIGGLFSSTLLTLVVIPVVYLWAERFSRRVNKLLGASGE